MPAMSRASTSAPARPFPPAIERSVGVVGRPLTWLWDHGFRFLVVLDGIALYLTMVVISFVRFGFSFDWDTYPLSRYFVGFAIATAIHLVINYFSGLYEREPRLGVRPWLPRALLATGIGVAVQGLAFVLLDRYLMPRLNLAVFFVVASFVLVANRRLSRRLAVRRQGPPRVVLVGEPASIELATRHLGESDRDAIVVDRVGSPELLTDRGRRRRCAVVPASAVRDGSGRLRHRRRRQRRPCLASTGRVRGSADPRLLVGRAGFRARSGDGQITGGRPRRVRRHTATHPIGRRSMRPRHPSNHPST
jgi:hypothetical protein